MTAHILTQDELKRQLHYNPETGIFTRLVSNSSRVKLGDIAGYLTKNGYIGVKVNDKQHYAHRLAFLYMDGMFPPAEVDHIDCVRDNNAWDNLRHATRSENQRNMEKPSNNTSGYRGVCFNKARAKYQARCNVDGKMVYLGLYNTPELAYEARTSYAKSHHGQFYRG